MLLKRVINATGVVLHTNASRAPWGEAVLARALPALSYYSNLELDLNTGVRGRRDDLVQEPLCRLTGAERVLISNNNAGATLLALHAVGNGRAAAVSRSQLVEIGGAFRLPEVMKAGGVGLMAVGTVNRTTVDDYRAALDAGASLVVLAHRSNFYFKGPYEEPAVTDVIALARSYRRPVLFDLGSGLLNRELYAGVIPPQEPTVVGLLAAGVDVVTFSGDKLLGGPQSGIAAGAEGCIAAMAADHLYRALRPGKETYALLGATVDAYLEGRPEEIPVYRLLHRRDEELRAVADAVADVFRPLPGFRCEVVPDEALVGGGTLPHLALPTLVVRLARDGSTPRDVAALLRRLSPPILGRIVGEGVGLDVRSVLEEDLPLLRHATAPLASRGAVASGS